MPESKTEWIAGSFPHPEDAAALFERLMASNTLGGQFAAHATGLDGVAGGPSVRHGFSPTASSATRGCVAIVGSRATDDRGDGLITLVSARAARLLRE